MVKWIESNGGPLLLLGESLLANWAGADGPRPGPTDYERAAAVRDFVGVVPVDDGYGLVLWGEPLPTTWWSRLDAVDGLFVRWIAAESDEQVNDTLEKLSDDVFVPSKVFITLTDPNCMLFDSAMPGEDILTPSMKIRLLPGRYRIDTAEYAKPGEIELLLHRVVLVG